MSTDSKDRIDEAVARAAASRGFERTGVWIFDLDNTLYPADCDLFAQVDRKMGEFIAKFLEVPFDYARHLQKTYYRQYGTTLAGMMHIHKMDPRPFLDYVHDIDLTPVPQNPRLAAAIDSLPGRKLIFTAGSHSHAERVAGKLGILHLFEDIIDIVDSEYVTKDRPEPFDRLLRSHAVDPLVSAMFEDTPHNLTVPHALGMTTVLVHSLTSEAPAQISIRGWSERPDHIHHMTSDLPEFLLPLGTTR